MHSARVRLHPSADLWMRGVGNTIGTVEKVGRRWIHVRFPGWGTFKFPLNTDLLEVISERA